MTPTHLSRLAAHLDVAPEVAAQALDELTASLREALRQQGTLTLQDVGTFWSEQVAL
jgi:nucleoid DNA-binding protein